MIYSDRKVTTIIISSELRNRHLSLLKCTRFRYWFLEFCFFLDSAWGAASDSAFLCMFGERSWECQFMDGLTSSLLKFFFGDVLFWEISEWRMWIFGRVLVFPRFVGLVVLFAEYIFELIFAWVFGVLHCISEARLSLRSELAIELCCNLGSML
jgi:hypothetical protein